MRRLLATAVARNVAALSIASAIAAGGAFLVNVAIARHFGPEQFGRFSFAFAVAGLFAIFSHGGVDLLITRDVARDRRRTERSFGVGLVLTGSLAALGVAALVVFAVLAAWQGSAAWSTAAMMVLAGATLLPATVSTLCRAIFRAFERMEFDLLLSVAGTAVMVVAGGALLAVGAPLVAVVAVYPLAALAGAVVGAVVMQTRFAPLRPAWDAPYVRYLTVAAVPFTLNGILTTVYGRVDTIMLGRMEGTAAVGLYSAAYTLSIPIAILGPSVARALFPRFASTFASAQHSYRSLMLGSLATSAVLVVAVGVATTILARPVLGLVFGEQYREATGAMRILAWTGGLAFLNAILLSALEASDRQVRATAVLGAGVILNVLLNLALIPRMGYSGAALASLVTQAFAALLILSLGVLSATSAAGAPRPPQVPGRT